jgi:transposase-like protein
VVRLTRKSAGLWRGISGRDQRSISSPFDAGPWGRKYEAIGKIWRRQWEQVIPFFAFPEAVRRITYTTNAIEALFSDFDWSTKESWSRRRRVVGKAEWAQGEANPRLSISTEI